jgi:RimK family alpha-L-glutamate ligase
MINYMACIKMPKDCMVLMPTIKGNSEKRPVIAILTSKASKQRPKAYLPNYLDKNVTPSEMVSQAILQQGGSVRRIYADHLEFQLSDEGIMCKHDGQPISPATIGLIWPYIGSHSNPLDAISVLTSLKFLEKMNFNVINGARSINKAINKAVTYSELASKNIPIPKTVYAVNPSASQLEDILGTGDLIEKKLYGGGGKGVKQVIAKDCAISMTGDKLVQEAVGLNKGADERYWVVGDQAVAAMHRVASKDSYISNISSGGTHKFCKPDPQLSQLAVQATKALGLEIGGVDLINTPKGPMVLEVNNVPCFPTVENSPGKVIANAYAKLLLNKVRKQR